MACTGQASQLSQRLGDLLVSAAHSAPPAVALAWCRTLVEHGVDANHVAHVHVGAPLASFLRWCL